MKKLICLLLAAVLCLGLCACGGGKAPKEVSFDDMSITSIRNAETGDTLELGMSQGEIEDMIGAGTEGEYDIVRYGTDQDGIEIVYNGSIAKTLVVYGESLWRLKHGIAVNDKLSDMFKYYGDRELKVIKDSNGKEIVSYFPYAVGDNGEIAADDGDDYDTYVFAVPNSDGETIKTLEISKD